MEEGEEIKMLCGFKIKIKTFIFLSTANPGSPGKNWECLWRLQATEKLVYNICPSTHISKENWQILYLVYVVDQWKQVIDLYTSWFTCLWTAWWPRGGGGGGVYMASVFILLSYVRIGLIRELFNCEKSLVWFVGSLSSLCHSNGHIETMP